MSKSANTPSKARVKKHGKAPIKRKPLAHDEAAAVLAAPMEIPQPWHRRVLAVIRNKILGVA